MKLELRENMYVRTKDGEIHKIKSINDEYIEYENSFGIPYELKEYIVKASYNIIDILEVGDYVNGERIINVIPEDICGNEILDNQHIFTKDGEIFENEIKSIITKEQMEQMAYKVGE